MLPIEMCPDRLVVDAQLAAESGRVMVSVAAA
jgi:hypothetical protein